MENQQITVQDFYFCYNSKMAKWLHCDKGIRFITKAIHPTSNQMFCMFAKSELLNQAICEYKATMKND